MKRAIAVLALVSCKPFPGPDPAPDAPFHSFPSACAPQACETGNIVTSAADLVSIIESDSTWQSMSEYSTGCLTATKDLPVSGTITIDGNSIALPANCPSCRPDVVFRVSDDMPGVECRSPEYWWDFRVCGEIAITDTTVRLRMGVRDTHPGPYNYAAIVEVIEPCDAPCAEFACSASHSCYSTARDYCAFCLAGTNEECACWEGSEFAADGTACSFYLSGDIVEVGTCHLGVCAR